MAKSSIFREFMTAMREHWRVAMPGVQPLGPALPRASTFYAGVARPLGMHVFLQFQHSAKAWEVGQFTVNVVLSCHEGEPARSGPGFAPLPGQPFTEGSYRIGWLVGGRDKWWHLRDDRPPVLTEAWRPTSYADPAVVLAEAVADITRGVRAVLGQLGVPAGAATGDGPNPALQPAGPA